MLLKEWGVKAEYLKSQEIMVMKNMANFLEKVEIMTEPGMK